MKNMSYHIRSTILTICLLGLISCTGPNLIPGRFPSSNNKNLSEKQIQIKSYARGFLGIPYRYGGTTRNGMDCSGFVMRIYKDLYGIKLPHSANKLYRKGRKISLRIIRPGDLVFFRNGNWSKASHVGIYLDQGNFIHASSSRGVIISHLSEKYYKTRFIGARRLIR